VNAGAGNFSSREESGKGSSTVEIGLDATHHVMGRRTNRNSVARQIQAGAPARCGNQRKPSVDKIGIQSLERQVHRPTGASSLTNDRARDSIARREVTGRFVGSHERLAVSVDQSGALTAQCF
jgi:hypothetical protein